MDIGNGFMQLKLISAQPATQYYAWQVEVFLTQLQRFGYDLRTVHVLGGYIDDIDESWYNLYAAYREVNFFFYTYNNTEYAPAMQSDMLAQHFHNHQYLKDCAIFFHDADFVFTKYFDFTPYLQDDKWYFSDTISYIGAEYIKSKDESILDIMCATVGISREVVEANQDNSGGAQKLMKNVTSDYWREVNVHSVNLYDLLKKVSHIKPSEHQHGIQIWTASMWAELWTAWKRGYDIVVHKDFDFCWATCHVSKWDDLSFFHNAGVSSGNKGLFYKAHFINDLPYGCDVNVSTDHCSSKYYELVQSIQTKLVSL